MKSIIVQRLFFLSPLVFFMACVLLLFISSKQAFAVNNVIISGQTKTIRVSVRDTVDQFIQSMPTNKQNTKTLISQSLGSATTSNLASVALKKELSFEAKDFLTSQAAIDKAKNGNYRDAYIMLYDAINTNPVSHQARISLVTLLFSKKQYQQAELLLDKGRILSPNLSSYKKMKARLLLQRGLPHEALQILRSFPPKIDEDMEYFELMASLAQITQSHQDAISLYQALLNINSNNARWWAALASSFESIGMQKEALSSYQLALLDPTLSVNLKNFSQARILYLSQL